MRSLLIVSILLTRFASAQADEPAQRKYQSLLARECDALIASAVKRPYGWAWALTSDQDSKKTPRNVAVSLEPAATPAAGLLLLYTGDLLHEPKYTDAARNVARGIAAAQHSSGKFPTQALFGPTAASSNEPAAPLPDRAFTRGALALLLSVLDSDEKDKPEIISRAAARGASWLLRQQAESGAWPITYPAGALPQDAMRLVRLDTSDTRDCILTMLYAYEVLGDPMQRRSVEKSAAFLIKARSPLATNIAPGLWPSACIPTGVRFDKPPEFSADANDILASRYAMQSLFAIWVILGDGQRLTACEIAAKSIDELIKGDDGELHQHFSKKGVNLGAPPAAQQPNQIFGPSTAPLPPPATDAALLPSRQAVALARNLGREQFRDRLTAAGFTPKQHLAQTITGLSDQPMAGDFPLAPTDAPAYLKQYEREFTAIEQPAPADLNARMQRLWALFLRARVEQRLGI
jgi:hypothetical protein